MSGTDPDAGRNRPIDRTQSYRPGQAGGTPPPPDPNLPKIPGISLHYEIARGGMGVVYSGRQDFLDRRVAVKLLSVELGGESFVQRFQREAKILAGIKHPNIVACHLAGTTDDGQSYLVMEFIDGPSLKKWVADNGPLSVPAALRLTRAVAQALAHAHTLGIIHRDVKPENILLETVTSTALDVNFPFTPKVVDLGLARGADTGTSLGLTSPGSVMGTPATMSPEQYDEPEAVDFRTDIYGLGCALYEMLVGRPAFRGKKLTDIVTQKRAQTAPDPCSENAKIPPAVGALVQCMLATHRDDRPRSYKELDERLAELLTALTVNRTRSQPTAPPVGGDTGATIVAKITPPTPGLGAVTDRAAAPSSPPAGSPPASGPGLLRTAEINFLAEGLGAGPAAGPAATAFRDSGVAPPAAAPTGATISGVPAPAAAGSGKRWSLIGGAALVAAALGVALSMTGGGPGPTPQPEPEPPVVDPKPPVNQRPRASISGPTEVDLRRSFEVSITASDPDGDALTFEWTYPSEHLIPKSATNGDRMRFDLFDGLPGVRFDVVCEVRDGKGEPLRVRHTVAVGDCPVSMPWVGFKGKADWKQDRTGLGWNDQTTDTDSFLSCTAWDELRTLQTTMGEEVFWEWFGTLESDQDIRGGKATEFAALGLRLELGDAGWLLVCSRSGSDGERWSLELKRSRRQAGKWLDESLNPAQIAIWTPGDDVQLGSFSLLRSGRDLRIRFGCTLVPEDGPPRELSSSEWRVALGDDVGEQKLTFFVDKGRGVFRVSRR